MILLKKEKYFWEVTLNRPELHNAFNPEMIAEITSVFNEASDNDELRYVYLNGNGKSFSAGADLNWMKSMKDYSVDENQKDSIKLFEMFEAIYNCKVPTVAKVHGNVFGGGLGLVAACDIVAAETATNFCFSEVKWGLAPATISPFLLRKISESHALETMLTAKKFKADKAYEMNLVHFQGTAQSVEDYLELTFNQLLDNGPQAMRATKALIQAYNCNSWTEIKEKTAQVIAQRRVSTEGQAGLNFFVTKEKPDWKIQ